MNLKRFFKERILELSCFICILLILNGYLVSSNFFQGKYSELYYLNFVIVTCYLCFFTVEYIKWKKKFYYIYNSVIENKDVSRDFEVGQTLEEEIIKRVIDEKENKINIECRKIENNLVDLDEYIAKWVHEIKLPISVLNMILERIDDLEISSSLKCETEKINFLVNSMLYGSRTTSSCEDIFIKETNIKNLVKKSIKNNSFFLIKKHIDIKLDSLDYNVYTDGKWVIYILDQIISNAIKYVGINGEIKFYCEETENSIILKVRDNGIGIVVEDLERVFDKGFTGNNGRNNVYKSTGMGLYFSKKILNKLGHKVEVKSSKGEYTELNIHFYKISDYLNPIVNSHSKGMFQKCNIRD
ncbi:sensor histidine kinase [Clostridium frigidicarnis]|uniref:histidine kinase n=1 Tax=Clostridium frigidicarnis TaxID=84698 RepID=A0A1I0WRX2_9CLOT|nr:sensor histidine kinase [Clostridium frigidicarnis]SFA91505.1 Signal transduction histidine kinase [Clostridium frigidicarnis]